MSFFRNPEVKKSILFFAAAAAVCSFAASFFGGTEAAIAAAAAVLCCTVIHLILTYFRYRKIAALSLKIDEILHGGTEIRIDTYSEGELSVLQSEIGKMTTRLRQQAEALQKDKVFLSDSIADISHQIRTPLTSVNILVSMLNDERITPQRRTELTRELSRLLARIDWLITALLKMSKLDAGTVRFQNSVIPVKLLISRATEALAVPLDLRNQTLELELGQNVSFYGDMAWCAEALGNIIKNCMEHTPDDGTGMIQISAEENTVFTGITIRDNGCGIAAEDIPHLFERFYKGKNSSENNFGIGLALARMIIDSQNGTVKAENNKDGTGATFTIKFYKGDI